MEILYIYKILKTTMELLQHSTTVQNVTCELRRNVCVLKFVDNLHARRKKTHNGFWS